MLPIIFHSGTRNVKDDDDNHHDNDNDGDNANANYKNNVNIIIIIIIIIIIMIMSMIMIMIMIRALLNSETGIFLYPDFYFFSETRKNSPEFFFSASETGYMDSGFCIQLSIHII